MKIKFILTLMVVFSLYLIVSFSRDLWQLWQKEKAIEKSQLNLEQLKLKNEALQKQLQYVSSQAFVEKEAREKLGMAKESETVLVLPENLKEIISVNQSEISDNQRLPNWQRWLKLFF